MSFNSKYTGQQVENLLDQVANGNAGGGGEGGVSVEIDPIFSASPAAKITDDDISAWNNKVDKVEGKQLSTEDFTTLLKQKLEGLSNYDDTEIQEAVSKLRTDLDTLVSGDTTTAIKTFNEIIAFLDGISDTEDLSGIISSIEQQIAAKQEKLVSGTNIKTINGESILGEGNIKIVGSGSSAYPMVNHGTSDNTFELTPNVFHVWGEVAELDLTLGEEIYGLTNEYLFQFYSGETKTSLSIPDTIRWANGYFFNIRKNATYQISIKNNVATFTVTEDKVWFPMYLETEENPNGDRYCEPNANTHYLWDYVEETGVYDGYHCFDVTFDNVDVFLDGHRVRGMLKEDKTNTWDIDVDIDYGYFSPVILFTENGVIHAYDDD